MTGELKETPTATATGRLVAVAVANSAIAVPAGSFCLWLSRKSPDAAS